MANKKNQPTQSNPSNQPDKEKNIRDHLKQALWAVVFIWPLATLIGYYMIYRPIDRNATAMESLQDQTGESLKKFDERLDRLDRSIATVESLPTTVAKLDDRLDALDKSLAKTDGLADQLRDVKKDLSDIDGRVTKIGEQVQRIDMKVETVADVVDKTSKGTAKDIDAITTRLKKIDGSLSTIETKVSVPTGAPVKTKLVRLRLPRKPTVDGDSARFVFQPGMLGIENITDAQIQISSILSSSPADTSLSNLSVDANILSGEVVVTVTTSEMSRFLSSLEKGEWVVNVDVQVLR